MHFYTIPEVAELLRISNQRAYELARTGLFPATKLGRQVRVEESKLKEWINNGGQSLPGGWRNEA